MNFFGYTMLHLSGSLSTKNCFSGDSSTTSHADITTGSCGAGLRASGLSTGVFSINRTTSIPEITLPVERISIYIYVYIYYCKCML